MKVGNKEAICPKCGYPLGDLIDDYRIFHCDKCGERFYYYHDVVWKTNSIQ